MPNKQHYYEPDALDCNTVVGSLAEDFGVYPEIRTEYGLDLVRVIVKCYSPSEKAQGLVQVQAMVSAPLKSRRNLYTMQYSALLDCWHQLDRGLLGVATTPITRSWNGRPVMPAPHNK